MTNFIIHAIASGGYFGIFLLMAAENIFPPIPSEVIMGLGGIAVARGHMEIVALIAAGTLGTTAGNYFWYALGRRFGYLGLRPMIERWGRWLTLEWEDVEKLHGFFRKRGHWVVFVCRFMPALRTMISLPAGMAAMPRWKFLLWTTAGAAIWNTVLAGAGLLLGSRYGELEHYVGPLAIAIFAVMAAAYVYRVVTWRPAAKRAGGRFDTRP